MAEERMPESDPYRADEIGVEKVAEDARRRVDEIVRVARLSHEASGEEERAFKDGLSALLSSIEAETWVTDDHIRIFRDTRFKDVQDAAHFLRELMEIRIHSREMF